MKFQGLHMYMLSSHSLRPNTRSIKEMSFKLAFQEGLYTVELREYTEVVNPSSSHNILLHIVTDLFNELPGNNSVNTD